MQLLTRHCLKLSSFADLNALVPRVTKVGVAGTSAASKPRTATATTASFAGFWNHAALGASGVDGHSRD